MEQILEELVEKNRRWADEGTVADYIPKLSEANPNILGITVMKGCKIFSAGDWDYRFSIQSISKIFALMLALKDNGMEAVFRKVGMEPTGDPYNSIIKLETTDPAKPLNPMINAGAITVTSLIKGATRQEKFQRILDFIRDVCGNSKISYNHEIYESEKVTGDRNRALAYFLRDKGIIAGDVEGVLDVYFKQCAIEVNTKDIAKIAYYLANQGVYFGAKQDLVSRDLVRIVKAFMVTCGMYDASGEFAIRVGIPAKSGVSGGILALVPNKMGIGVVGPALDEKGNSICGVHLLEDLSRKLDLSIF